MILATQIRAAFISESPLCLMKFLDFDNHKKKHSPKYSSSTGVAYSNSSNNSPNKPLLQISKFSYRYFLQLCCVCHTHVDGIFHCYDSRCPSLRQNLIIKYGINYYQQYTWIPILADISIVYSRSSSSSFSLRSSQSVHTNSFAILLFTLWNFHQGEIHQESVHSN